jgi:hypothetical protein
MVAYSFKDRFIGPIRAGLGLKHVNERGQIAIPGPSPKRQTIRAAGRRRHARPGETLQLYYGMRTRHCFRIGEARCTAVEGVLFKWSEWQSFLTFDVMEREPNVYRRVGGTREIGDLDVFAKADGFDDFAQMREFWMDEHGEETFEGLMIRWEPIPALTNGE